MLRNSSITGYVKSFKIFLASEMVSRKKCFFIGVYSMSATITI